MKKIITIIVLVISAIHLRAMDTIGIGQTSYAQQSSTSADDLMKGMSTAEMEALLDRFYIGAPKEVDHVVTAIQEPEFMQAEVELFTKIPKQLLASAATKPTQTTKRPKSNTECPTCHKKFVTSSALRQHRLRHDGGRKFQCIFCAYATIVKANLVRHMKNIHHHANKYGSLAS